MGEYSAYVGLDVHKDTMAEHPVKRIDGLLPRHVCGDLAQLRAIAP